MSTVSQRMVNKVKKDVRNSSFVRRSVPWRSGRKIELFFVGDMDARKSEICRVIQNFGFANQYFPTKMNAIYKLATQLINNQLVSLKLNQNKKILK
jgi:hypothetical protein